MRARASVGISAASVAFATTVLPACGPVSERGIAKSLADQVKPPALVFDLDESPEVATTLVVASNAKGEELRSIVLPFATRASDRSADVLTSWGSKDGVTLVSYVATPSGATDSSIALKPVFETSSDLEFTQPDLPGAVYFMSSGLKRRFVYQSPNRAQLMFRAWSSAASAVPSSVTSVLVRLPVGVDVIEPRAQSRQPITSKDTPLGRVKVFANSASGPDADAPVDILYQVPPTSAQNEAGAAIVKAFVAGLALFGGLFFVNKTSLASPRTRKITLWVLGGIELVLGCGLAWWSWHTRTVLGYGQLGDVIVALIGFAGVGLAFRIKGT